MVAPQVLRALAEDSRLSDRARVLWVYLAGRGAAAESQEVPHKAFRRVLHGAPQADTVGRHLAQLELYGWVERTPGGRGHSDSYQVIAPGKNLNLNIGAEKNAHQSKNSSQEKPGPNSIGPEKNPELTAPSSSREIGEVGVEGTPAAAGGDSAPSPNGSSPEELDAFQYPLASQARKALEKHDERLQGCRDALRDYLRTRVKPARQHGYVHSVASLLNGLQPNTFRGHDGRVHPREEWPQILALALNDLMASDEGRMSRPEGDVGNLYTKASILARKRGETYPSHGGKRGQSNAGKGRAGQGSGNGAGGLAASVGLQ